jgi:hypothetical protein
MLKEKNYDRKQWDVDNNVKYTRDKKKGNKHLKWNVYTKKNVRNVVIISINLYAQKNL